MMTPLAVVVVSDTVTYGYININIILDTDSLLTPYSVDHRSDNILVTIVMSSDVTMSSSLLSSSHHNNSTLVTNVVVVVWCYQ